MTNIVLVVGFGLVGLEIWVDCVGTGKDCDKESPYTSGNLYWCLCWEVGSVLSGSKADEDIKAYERKGKENLVEDNIQGNRWKGIQDIHLDNSDKRQP